MRWIDKLHLDPIHMNRIVIVIHREFPESNEMVDEGSVLSVVKSQSEPPHPPLELANRND